ncbi:unnamed protein product, partial [Amoebophrya sp. A120]
SSSQQPHRRSVGSDDAMQGDVRHDGGAGGEDQPHHDDDIADPPEVPHAKPAAVSRTFTRRFTRDIGEESSMMSLPTGQSSALALRSARDGEEGEPGSSTGAGGGVAPAEGELPVGSSPGGDVVVDGKKTVQFDEPLREAGDISDSEIPMEDRIMSVHSDSFKEMSQKAKSPTDLLREKKEARRKKKVEELDKQALHAGKGPIDFNQLMLEKRRARAPKEGTPEFEALVNADKSAGRSERGRRYAEQRVRDGKGGAADPAKMIDDQLRLLKGKGKKSGRGLIQLPGERGHRRLSTLTADDLYKARLGHKIPLKKDGEVDGEPRSRSAERAESSSPDDEAGRGRTAEAGDGARERAS